MKCIFLMILATGSIWANIYELSYDCGSGTGTYDIAYSIGGTTHTSSRVHFTVPSLAYGTLLTQAKVHGII